MAKKKTIDIVESLTHFFNLPDWKDRCIKLGGVYAGFSIIYIVISIASAIPFVGIFFALLQLGVMGLYILFSIYLQGYRYELVKAYKEKTDIESVRPLDRFVERATTGLKLILNNIIYLAPAFVFYILFFGLIFFSTFLLSIVSENQSGGEIFAIIIIFVSFIPLILVVFYQLAVEYFVVPAIINEYLKEESLAATLKVKAIWKFIKDNFLNLLVYLAILMIVGFGMAMIFMISWILVFICVGIILVPVLVAIIIPYMVHLQAYVVAQVVEDK